MERATGVTIPERVAAGGCTKHRSGARDEISEETPVVDSRLPDGSRVAVVLSPVSWWHSTGHPKVPDKRYNAAELVRLVRSHRGTHGAQQRRSLAGRTSYFGRHRLRQNHLVEALAAIIRTRALIVIEDTSELQTTSH